MFGCIVSGRLVQTDFQQVGENQFLINIPEADNINHIVLFLTGQIPLPIGMAGSVYFSWPNPSAPPSWILLGYISNNKPSAIFKISQLKKLDEPPPPIQQQQQQNFFGGTPTTSLNVFGAQPISHIAQIGISIEPEANVLQSTPAATTTNSYLIFGRKMLENFFNYASSFAINQTQMVPNPNESFIPFSTLQNWFISFERRLQQNPNFWK